MIGLRRLLWLALTLLAMGASPAWAHTKSETHSVWVVSGSGVQLTYTIPEIEARRLASAGTTTVSAELLGGYLAKHVAVEAAGQRCRAAPPRAVASASGFRRIEIAFQCDAAPSVLKSTAFFDLVPSHVNLAQVRTADGAFVQQVITKDRTTLEVGAGASSPLQDAHFLEYVRMGMMHIFTGVDHMSFLIGLVLIARRLRDLTFVVTGFTLGHSITLALAVTGVLRPHAEYIDALVALTIALIGAENIVVATRKPLIVAAGMGGLLLAMVGLRLAGFGGLPTLLLLGAGIFSANYLMISGHLRDAGRLRLIVTLVFGLIHGFGFAADLLEMRMPAGRMAELLVGFNLGVEVGQLSLVLAAVLLVAGLSRLKLAPPRAIVVDVASSGLVALGVYWLISRGYAL